MGRQLLDVEHAQPVAGEDPTRPPGARSTRSARDRSCRIGSRSMSRRRCGTSMVSRPPGASRSGQAGGEVVEVGHVGEHVVGDDQVGRTAARPRARARAPRRRTRTSVGMPAARAAAAMFRAGSMPSAGMPRGHEVLEQVAVVAGDLDDRRLVEAELSARSPRRRIDGHARPSCRSTTRSRRTRVKMRLRCATYGWQLDEPARVADPDVQRIERLHLSRAGPRQEALARWATSRGRRRDRPEAFHRTDTR